jgi:endonuclease/exonuclease/phosphatase family metal-dependent hydrolase
VRLATFNVLHGRSVQDGLVVEQRVRDAVAALDVDVLAIQEVDREQPRSGNLDLARIAADALGAVAWRFVPTLLGTPGGIWRPVADAAGASAARGPAFDPHAVGSEEETGPAYGVALLSRLPVRSWRVIRLAPAGIRGPVLMPGTTRPVLLPDEPRVGLAAELADGRTVATAHLSFVPGWNAVQLRRLTAELASGGRSTILLGDFNIPGRLPALLTGWRQLVRIPTYPAWRPRVQLDHVLASGAVGAVRAAKALPLTVSDHRALIVEMAG